MNAPNNPSRDQMLDENLRRMALNISLPTTPAPERLAAWKAGNAEPWPDSGIEQGRSRLFRLWPLFTSAAAAAGFGLAVIVFLGNPKPVSAETILKSFRAVLGGPICIRLEGIGFESEGISGQIVRDVDSGGKDHRYSEIHTLLKSDNPQWADIDAVTVLNETPEQAWIFVRGSGGGGPQGLGPDGRYHVQVIEQYYAGRVSPFLANALELGSVPLGLSFGAGGSAVHYAFAGPERDYLNSLVKLAQHIGDAESAEDLLARVKSAAGDVRVQPSAQGWRLRAAAFQPHVLFPDLDLSVADVDLPRVLDQIGLDTEFVDSCKYWNVTGAEPLEPVHVTVDTSALHALADETRSADQFAARVRPLAREVSVFPGAHGGTTVRLVGYDWKLDTSERDRQRQIATEIVPGIELLIEYDAHTDSVRWAEFRNLSPNGGTIRLEPGPAELDPALLDPKHWITDETLVYEQ